MNRNYVCVCVGGGWRREGKDKEKQHKRECA